MWQQHIRYVQPRVQTHVGLSGRMQLDVGMGNYPAMASYVRVSMAVEVPYRVMAGLSSAASLNLCVHTHMHVHQQRYCKVFCGNCICTKGTTT